MIAWKLFNVHKMENGKLNQRESVAVAQNLLPTLVINHMVQNSFL